MSLMKNFKEKTSAFYAKMRFEFQRLSTICRHMFSASQVNAQLNKTYLELGQLTAQALEAQEVAWENHHAQNLIVNIQDLKKKLELIEKEVQEAKFAPLESFFKK